MGSHRLYIFAIEITDNNPWQMIWKLFIADITNQPSMSTSLSPATFYENCLTTNTDWPPTAWFNIDLATITDGIYYFEAI